MEIKGIQIVQVMIFVMCRKEVEIMEKDYTKDKNMEHHNILR